MKLGELKAIIDKTIEGAPTAVDCEVTVLIQPDRNNVMGSMPSTPVKNAHKGFDWDSWQFMLTPIVPLKKTGGK